MGLKLRRWWKLIEMEEKREREREREREGVLLVLVRWTTVIVEEGGK